MVNVNSVADFFILQAECDAGDVMTHLKLQKLLYYAQAWYLAMFKRPLFKDSFEAWAHGPVCLSVWNRFKGKGAAPITPEDVSTAPRFDVETNSFLCEIWRVYGQFTAKRLEELTHNETPWIEARGGVPEYGSSDKLISHNSMRDYYSQRLNEK